MDLDQVVAHNLRAARLVRGWSQTEVAAAVELLIGWHMTRDGTATLERSWSSMRIRRLNLQDIAMFAVAFDLAIVWFLVPPAGDRRQISRLGRRLDDLPLPLFGANEQLGALHERLWDLAGDGPWSGLVAPRGGGKGAGVGPSDIDEVVYGS